jgi:hypothetical protein
MEGVGIGCRTTEGNMQNKEEDGGLHDYPMDTKNRQAPLFVFSCIHDFIQSNRGALLGSGHERLFCHGTYPSTSGCSKQAGSQEPTII